MGNKAFKTSFGCIVLNEIKTGYDYTAYDEFYNVLKEGVTMTGSYPAETVAENICLSMNGQLLTELDYDKTLLEIFENS